MRLRVGILVAAAKLMGKILVIDDSATARAVIHRTLSRAGYEVLALGEPSGALEAAETFRPDAIVCDVEMPDMNGLDVLGVLSSSMPRLPVLMLTSASEAGTIVAAMRHGACGYVLKGGSGELLLEEVRAAIETGRLRERNQSLEDANLSYREGLEKMVEEKTAELMKLDMARAQAEKLAALTTLVAGAAHEINNPLSVMLANIRWIEGTLKKNAPAGSRADDDAEEMLAAARDATKSGERIARIIASLRRLAHPAGSGRSSNVGRALEDTRIFCRGELAGRATLTAAIPDTIDVAIPEDALLSVLSNLLVNAAHAVEPGRGRISVSACVEGAVVVLEVKDNGGGIRPEFLSRLREPFFTTKEPGKGTGLGLSLVDRIAHGAGGSVEIESALGEGTTIRVRLPVAKPREMASTS